jgi:S-adenosyl-L-methionine hydrolase (adenosine-forming)
MNEATQIVTFITDFGSRDYYMGMVKGAILSGHRNLNLVDITHDVKSFDIVRASFILKNVYKSFPAKTIHIVSVNNYTSQKSRFIAFEYDEHYFIGPDNGIFSLIFGSKMPQAYWLEQQHEAPLSMKEVFAKAVQHIATGKPLLSIGQPLRKIVQRITLQPVINRFQVMGSVIHIDKYENCIINITRELFDKAREDRRFAVFFKRNNPIIKLSKNYYDVPVGDTLCMFNSAGYLEIAINMGKASSLLGLNIDDTIQIDFI